MIGRGGIVFCIGGRTQCYVENTPFLISFDEWLDKKGYYKNETKAGI